MISTKEKKLLNPKSHKTYRMCTIRSTTMAVQHLSFATASAKQTNTNNTILLHFL